MPQFVSSPSGAVPEVYVVIFMDSGCQHLGTFVFAALPTADQVKAAWTEKHDGLCSGDEFHLEPVDLSRTSYWTVTIRDEDGEESDISATIWREAVR